MASFDSVRPKPLRASHASTSATVLPTRVVFAFWIASTMGCELASLMATRAGWACSTKR